MIYDAFFLESYFGAFLGAGIPPIVGAILMFAIRLVPPRDGRFTDEIGGYPVDIHHPDIVFFTQGETAYVHCAGQRW